MSELDNRFAARAAASPICTKRYRHVWTQEQGGVTYGDGVNFWPAVYDLSTSISSTALTVNVLIGATDGGGGFTAEVATRWEGAIKRIWSDKVTISVNETIAGVVKTHTRRVLVEISWNHSDAEFTVECKQTPGMDGLIASIDNLPTPLERRNRMVGLGVLALSADGYDVAWPKWKKVALLRDVVRDNVFHGTPNMLQWGAKDSEATKYNGVAVDATIYGQRGFTTDSIMNNTVSSRGSKLYTRHFNQIATDFMDLMSTRVKPSGNFTGSPIIRFL
jgi:hypothetical protein